MPSTYSHIVGTDREHAKAFGRMLRRWREINGWTQYTAEKWSKQSEFITLGHGTMSDLENGKLGNPGPKTFLFLHEVNRRVADSDFSGVTSRDLRDQLEGSKAILNDQGEPWSTEYWWAVHKGLRPIPDWLSAPVEPLVNDEQAAELSAGWVAGLREVARISGASVAQLSDAYQLAPAEHQERWQEVLLGLRPYSGEELCELRDHKREEWRPALWLQAWAWSLESAPSGGGASRNHDLNPANLLRVGYPTR